MFDIYSEGFVLNSFLFGLPICLCRGLIVFSDGTLNWKLISMGW